MASKPAREAAEQIVNVFNKAAMNTFGAMWGKDAHADMHATMQNFEQFIDHALEEERDAVDELISLSKCPNIPSGCGSCPLCKAVSRIKKLTEAP